MGDCKGCPCRTKTMNNKPKYNPNIHHRRSIRLKGYDYSQAGLYFITICCNKRKCRFGKIENDEMILNEYGTIAYNEWVKLSERFTNFELDVFQIMPNHMHGIILLNEFVGAGFTPAQNNNDEHIARAGVTPTQNNNDEHNVRAGFTPTQNNDDEHNVRAGFTPTQNANVATTVNEKGQPQGAPTIGDIVGAYKSLTANNCLEIYKSKHEMMGKLWQRNYHEHIIRNQQSYHTISNYIINNPAKWAKDKFYNK